jgi:hypothetical protein
MASIRKEIVLEAPAEHVWDTVRDSRLVWIADLLPNELADDIRGMIEHATMVMKKTLEASAPAH